MATEDLADTIAERVKDPRSMTADGQTVNERSINEAIRADQYLGARQNQKSGGLPFTLTRVVPK